MIEYDRKLQQIKVAGRRLHHGATGVIVAVLGALLAIHDRADWRDWFTGR